MKLSKSFFKLSASAVVVGALMVGCETPTIPLTMNVAGEIKLNGVSKIALAGFNSLPGDAFTGKMAADKETCALVKRAVAAAFYSAPTYQVVDLDIEKEITSEVEAEPKHRFDAVVYGRLWWQVTPETNGQYPKQFTLSTWQNVPYTKKVLGKSEPDVAPVTTLTKDVIQMMDYRVQNATLMLTLSFYRLEGNGEVVKITDTYQVTNEGFTLMNGEIRQELASVGLKEDNAVTRLQETAKKDDARTAYQDMFEPKEPSLAEGGKALAEEGKALAEAGKGFWKSLLALFGFGEEPKKEDSKKEAKPTRDATGKLVLTQKTVSLPSELQAKLMLAASVTRSLTAKVAPQKVTFDVEASFKDARLENLLKNGAYGSAEEYAMYMLRNKLGKQICEKLGKQFLPQFLEAASYPVPDSTKQLPGYNEELVAELMKADFNLHFYTLGVAHASAQALEDSAVSNDKMIAYLANQDLDEYFYAMAICKENALKLWDAELYHRFAFNVNPELNYALGLSRVHLALGEEARLAETKKAAKKAAKKASME